MFFVFLAWIVSGATAGITYLTAGINPLFWVALVVFIICSIILLVGIGGGEDAVDAAIDSIDFFD